MRLIDRDEVRARLTYEVCMPLVRRAMIALSRGETRQLLRSIIPLGEGRLFGIIMNPAMMLAWLLGLYLAWTAFGFHGGWLHVKLTGVVLLTGVHVYLGRAYRAFLRDERPKTQRHWRIMNEVPALLMIVIVLMVVLKPF